MNNQIVSYLSSVFLNEEEQRKASDIAYVKELQTKNKDLHHVHFSFHQTIDTHNYASHLIIKPTVIFPLCRSYFR